MSNHVYNLNQANSENVYDYVNSEYCTLESLKVKSKNKFSLLHVNIRSLTKNLEKLEELLAGIRTLPDIIAVTETRLKNSMNFGFRLQGCSIEHHDSPTSPGGVALFVKDSLAYRVENKFTIDTPRCENLWLQFDTNKSSTFVIGVVYRHPNSNYEDFQDKLDVTIAKLIATSSKYYICDDFNIDLLKYHEDKRVEAYVHMLHSYGCCIFPNYPTKVTPNSSTLIDHMYTNNDSDDLQNFILVHDISDHYPLFISAGSINPKFHHKKTTRRNLEFFQLEAFLTDLSEIMNEDITKNLYTIPVGNLFKIFIEKFESVLNKHAPLKELSRTEMKFRSKPWLTKGIMNSIKTKNALYKESKKM